MRAVLELLLLQIFVIMIKGDKKVYGIMYTCLELCALKRFFLVNIEDFAYLCVNQYIEYE
ncbi:hypothetical protein D7Y07_17010 [Bacteroides acidifaciens]|uniref:Uncharacterized protein n=1 Tax=Bacteroides acidifaciens TaxID=85831 RepID=A0A3L7YWR8_9BACE|nr:hypothetical protein D7Y07_17010 [Bacteroides acidifaciens]